MEDEGIADIAAEVGIMPRAEGDGGATLGAGGQLQVAHDSSLHGRSPSHSISSGLRAQAVVTRSAARRAIGLPLSVVRRGCGAWRVCRGCPRYWVPEI